MKAHVKTISGRINAETATEIQFLKKELDLNQTAVVQSAIHLLYQQTRAKKTKLTRFEKFKKTGFLRAIQAESDLSETYKEKYDEYLKKKHAN